MLFLTYWELNENMSAQERVQIAQKITSGGLFPSKGVKIIRWDQTPDAWGILLAEADSATDISLAIDMWRAAGAGFFKMTKTAPVTPITELMPAAAEMLKLLSAGKPN